MVISIIVATLFISCNKSENTTEIPTEEDTIEIENVKQYINKDRWINSLEGLRMRDAPNLEGKTITVIPNAEKVLLVEETGEVLTIQDGTGKWSQVKWQENEGWVFGGFLSIDVVPIATIEVDYSGIANNVNINVREEPVENSNLTGEITTNAIVRVSKQTVNKFIIGDTEDFLIYIEADGSIQGWVFKSLIDEYIPGYLGDELIEAVQDKNLDEVVRLVESGADVNSKNKEGNTVLWIAAEIYDDNTDYHHWDDDWNDNEIINFLTNSGADLMISPEGKSVFLGGSLDCGEDNNFFENGVFFLRVSCNSGDTFYKGTWELIGLYIHMQLEEEIKNMERSTRINWYWEIKNNSWSFDEAQAPQQG